VPSKFKKGLPFDEWPNGVKIRIGVVEKKAAKCLKRKED